MCEQKEEAKDRVTQPRPIRLGDAPVGSGGVRFQIAQEAKFLWHSYELEDGGGERRGEGRERGRDGRGHGIGVARGRGEARGEKSEEHLFPAPLPPFPLDRLCAISLHCLLRS